MMMLGRVPQAVKLLAVKDFITAVHNRGCNHPVLGCTTFKQPTWSWVRKPSDMQMPSLHAIEMHDVFSAGKLFGSEIAKMPPKSSRNHLLGKSMEIRKFVHGFNCRPPKQLDT